MTTFSLHERGFSLHERGWRDGFWGREPRSNDQVYLDGFHAGLRAGDRSRAKASDGAAASAPDLGGVASSAEVTSSRGA